MSYGAAFDARIPGFLHVEVSYTFVPTSVDLVQLGVSRKIADADGHYAQVGLARDFLPGMVRPFLSLTGGVTGFVVGSGYDDDVYLATAVGGGVKVLPSTDVGIRVEGRLMSTFIGTGNPLFCGGGGCTYGLMGSGILQPELTGGVFATF